MTSTSARVRWHGSAAADTTCMRHYVPTDELHEDSPASIPVLISLQPRFPTHWASKRKNRSRSLIDCAAVCRLSSLENVELFPTMYLLNPTSIAKSNAVDQLKLEFVSYSVDIGIICESWLKPKHDCKLFMIAGYALHRCDRVGRACGGICVYVRNTFNSCTYQFSYSRSIPPAVELTWLHIVSPSAKSDFVLDVCYHPPKPHYQTSDLISLINSDVEDIISHNPNSIVVFAGDLNGLDTSFLTIDCGLLQVNDAATHGPHILDKFFISRPGLCTFKTVLSSINTHHKAVVISDLSVPFRIRKDDKKIQRRCFDIRQSNLLRLQIALANYNWKPLLHETKVQPLYDDFTKIITHLINLYIPTKQILLRAKSPFFLTPLISQLLRRRNRFMRAGKLDKAGDISVKVGKLLADRRAQMLADLNDRDTRQLWAAVNTSRNRSVCNPLSHYGDRFADANAINEHFVEIATDPSYDRQQINNFIKPIEKGELSKFKFLEHDIVVALRSVKRTSQGAEPLPYWIFKQCSFELAPIITHLYTVHFGFTRIMEAQLSNSHSKSYTTT